MPAKLDVSEMISGEANEYEIIDHTVQNKTGTAIIVYDVIQDTGTARTVLLQNQVLPLDQLQVASVIARANEVVATTPDVYYALKTALYEHLLARKGKSAAIV